MIQSGPGGVVVEAFTGLFSVFESAKVNNCALQNFLLNLDIKGKDEFYRLTRTRF